MKKIWFITGAARGLGAAIGQAALAAGDSVVVTGRRRESVVQAFGPDGDRVLCLGLDVTCEEDATAAVEAAIARFGRIDVLVNNAGYGVLALFEETGDADARAQFDTNLFGVLNVTRAVLPVMRRQRSGRIFNVSSLGGIVGSPTGTLYCAAKFAVEGFTESLAGEVARFGIRVTIVEPGTFRTDFLDDSSAHYGSSRLTDYAELSTQLMAVYRAANRNQTGDRAKLAQALVRLASHEDPPLRFAVGSDAVAGVRGKIGRLQADLEEWEALSASTDADDASGRALGEALEA